MSRHPHQTGFEVTVRVATTAYVSEPRRPAYTQPHTGVDAEVERVRELHRTASELLGEKPHHGV